MPRPPPTTQQAHAVLVHPRALGAVPDSQVPGIKLSRGRPAISAGIDWYVRMDSSFVRLHGHGNREPPVTQCSQGTCQLSPRGEEFCIDGFIGPGRLLLFALSICLGKEDGIRAHRPYIQSAISIEQVNEISTTPAPDIGHHPITLKLIGRRIVTITITELAGHGCRVLPLPGRPSWAASRGLALAW